MFKPTLFSKETVDSANKAFLELKSHGFSGDFGGFSGYCSLGLDIVLLDGHFTKEELLALAMALEEKSRG